MHNVPVSRQGGYTLIELVVVIGLLAIIAAIAYPALSTDDSRELDVAAAEIAAAMRFARSESIRTGEPHGFRYLVSQKRVRVFRVDTSASPWTWIFDVYHPVTKQLYDYTIPPELYSSGGSVVRDDVFRNTCNRTAVAYFDADGTPWCIEPETVLLDYLELTIDTGINNAAVRLDGITGRVTVK